MKTNTLILVAFGILLPAASQASSLSEAMIETVTAQHQAEVSSGEFRATKSSVKSFAAARVGHTGPNAITASATSAATAPAAAPAAPPPVPRPVIIAHSPVKPAHSPGGKR